MRLSPFACVTVLITISACPASDVVGEGEGEADAGVVIPDVDRPEGAVCDSTEQCAVGLECAIGLDGASARLCTTVADVGDCCRCREEQTTCDSGEITGGCTIEVDEDGCSEGLVCANGGFGGDGCCCFPTPHCVHAEARPLFETCYRDQECASGLCSGWTGECAECQPNDCAAGCPEGEGCSSAGNGGCGFECAPVVGFQQLCHDGQSLEAQCTVVRTCGSGLECSGRPVIGDDIRVCDDVANEAEPCIDSQDVATDSCADGLRCTAAALCAQLDALREPGDHCDDGTQCVSGSCNPSRLCD